MRSVSTLATFVLSVALWSAGVFATAEQSARPAPSGVEGPDAVRAAIERAIPLLQSSARTWFEERPCASCHHQGLGMVAVTLARDRGFRIDQGLLDDQVRRTTPPPAWRDRYLLGEVSINEQIGESYRAVARGVAGAGRSPLTDLQVHMLAGKQHVSGHWNSYSHRPPLEDTEFTATAITIRALQLFRVENRAQEMADRVARARRWLESAGPRASSSEDRAMVLFGLRWAGAGVDAIRKARDSIVADQRKDGGWAQVTTRPSDSYATGQALVALNQAAGMPVTDPAYRRGVEFLLQSQRLDGSWLVETRRTRQPGLEHFETGFPHGKHQFISYAGSASGTLALILSLDGSPAPAIVRAEPLPRGEDPWGGAATLTPLMTAALSGTIEDMDRLIAAGADVNAATPGGITALMCAVRDPEKVRRLLSAGSNPNAAAKSGHTALMLAADYDRAADSVRALLDRGADPNAVAMQAIVPGATALRNAALHGDMDVARLLLDRGAALDIPVGDARFALPLLFAGAAGHVDVVDLLLSRGASPNARMLDLPEAGWEGTTALMMAAEDGNPDLVRLLLKRGADPNARDRKGLTPLMYAAASIDRGNTDIVQQLLAAGADPAVKTPQEETAVTMATKYGNREAAALLERSVAGRR
jgi:ankyrin repeat protein